MILSWCKYSYIVIFQFIYFRHRVFKVIIVKSNAQSISQDTESLQSVRIIYSIGFWKVPKGKL